MLMQKWSRKHISLYLETTTLLKWCFQKQFLFLLNKFVNILSVKLQWKTDALVEHTMCKKMLENGLFCPYRAINIDLIAGSGKAGLSQKYNKPWTNRAGGVGQNGSWADWPLHTTDPSFAPNVTTNILCASWTSSTTNKKPLQLIEKAKMCWCFKSRMFHYNLQVEL